MSRADHLRIDCCIVNVDGYKSRKSSFSAVSHPPERGRVGLHVGRSSMSAVGLMKLITTPLTLYYAQFKGFAQLTKTTAQHPIC